MIDKGFPAQRPGAPFRAELSLSLDVIFHLIEDAGFEHYMAALFDSAERFVVIYSSNVDQDWPVEHVKHRRFSAWIGSHRPDWELANKIPNKHPYDEDRPAETSFSDFFFFRRCQGRD